MSNRVLITSMFVGVSFASIFFLNILDRHVSGFLFLSGFVGDRYTNLYNLKSNQIEVQEKILKLSETESGVIYIASQPIFNEECADGSSVVITNGNIKYHKIHNGRVQEISFNELSDEIRREFDKIKLSHRLEINFDCK